MNHLRLALPLLLLPNPHLLADSRDAALKLPDVVISANRQVQARNDSSAANTVFTREDIDRLQPGSVTDLLSRARRASGPPAVVAACPGSTFAAPIRAKPGAGGWPTHRQLDLRRQRPAHLNVDQIERVEVLRGSRSVITAAMRSAG
jgi:vitamin B12 transporter